MRGLNHISLAIFLTAFGLSTAVAQAPFKRIKEGQGKGEVLFELGRPYESWVDGGYDYWSYANPKGQRCQVRFVDGGKVDKNGVTCQEPEMDRKPAYATQGKEFDWAAREETRDQRLEVYCGRKPNPSPGCAIDRCVAGTWYQKCQNQKP